MKHWSLTTLREKLIRLGAKVTRHAKYVTFHLAEVAVTRNLFAAILNRIARLAIPPPLVARNAASEEGESAPTRRTTPENHPNGAFPRLENRPRWARAEIMPKLSPRARRKVGGRVVRIARIASLEWFQTQPIWEMSDKDIKP